MSSINAAVVLTEILRSAPTSRKDIADRRGLSPATVSRAVDHLTASGLVREVGEVVESRRGRRAVQLDVVAERTHVIGVDLGASSTRVVLTDLAGRQVGRIEEATSSTSTATDLARAVGAIARRTAGTRWSTVERVVLGLPGSVDQPTGTVANANNLAQVEDTSFIATLQDAVGVPLTLYNDADLALLGELQLGAAHGASAAAMLTLGAGLGAALAYRGTIVQGRHGVVGELGQIPLDSRTRLEDLLTGPGIIRAAATQGLVLTSPAELFTDALDDSPTVRTLRARFDEALLLALTAVTVACEPEVIILGGRVSEGLESRWEGYSTGLRQILRYAPRLTKPALGAFAGAVGAAVRGLHDTYRDLGVAEGDLINIPREPRLTSSASAA